MISNELVYRIEELSQMMNLMKTEISSLKHHFNDSDMWDNSELMQNWKVSQRTLASWRAEGLIGFVQSGGKIWYTKENRDDFIRRNSVSACN